MTVPIKFIDSSGKLSEDYYPRPALKEVPGWFKKLYPFRDNVKPPGNSTGKRCVPMLDAMTAGYTLVTPVDVLVGRDQEKITYSWPHEPAVEFQQLWQIEGHKRVTDDYGLVPKMPNPWGVITPQGYSCLYIPPINSDDNLFEIFSGVVDTDRYHQNGSLPFLLRDPKWEGLIPAGTPMAQVIPFRRESYKMIIGNDEDQKLPEKQWNKLRSVFRDGYRKMFWSPKSYK